MKTNLHSPFIQRLLLLSLGLCVASAQAQEQTDPYKKPAATASTPATPEPADPEQAIMEDGMVSVTAEWMDLNTADAMSLMRGGLPPNSPALIQKIRALEAEGKAILIDAHSVITRSGQRATSEGTKEFLYPAEAQIVDKGGLTQANLNLSNTKLADGKITIVQEASSTPMPTSYEMRNLGGRMEIDAVIHADGKTIELNAMHEYTILAGWQEYGKVQVGGEKLPMIDKPVFSVSKVITGLCIRSAQTAVVGMTNVQMEDGTIDPAKKRLLLVSGLIFPVNAR